MEIVLLKYSIDFVNILIKYRSTELVFTAARIITYNLTTYSYIAKLCFCSIKKNNNNK